MDQFNLALKGVQGTLKDISTSISSIYKVIPNNFVPSSLKEAHNHLDALESTFMIKPKEESLPVIKFAHHRSRTSEIVATVPQDPCSTRLTSVTREKFQLKSLKTKFSRLHSTQSYQRPQFTRFSQARVVPKATRFDPSANPANISIEERDLGLFSIVNKGLVSRDTNLTEFIEFPSLQSKKMNLSTFTSQFQSPVTDRKIFTTAVEVQSRRRRENAESPDILRLGEIDSPSNKKKDRGVVKVVERHFLIVKRGKIKDNSDLVKFKKSFGGKWRTMNEVIELVEGYCKKMRYPKVVIDGKKLYEMQVDEVKPLNARMFKECVLNYQEIKGMMRSYKVAYRGKAGKHLAAVKIQTAYRRYFAQRQYRHLRALNNKAKIIQLYFRLYLKKLETKKNIQSVREDRIEQFKVRQRAFQANWANIKSLPRTEIHLGSIHPDATKTFYYAKQNSQLMRVFALTDPNLSIIYVSPVPIHNDITEYYYLSLQLCNIPDVRTRLTFVTPNHGMNLSNLYSTSKLLFLSSSTINEIKEVIKGKTAYIVPNEVSKDDIWLCDLLGIPLLCGEPNAVNDITTKTGCVDIFNNVQIKVPLQVSNLSTPDAFYKALADLIYQHLHKDIWMIKINHEVRSRGIAFLDVTKLKSVVKLRRFESLKEENWAEIHTELVKAMSLVVKIVILTLWESWNSFLLAFCSYGGVIQETPTARGNIASPVISVLVEPDGRVRYLCAVDRMQSREYMNAGVFFPQASLPHTEILEIGWKVGKELYRRGVFGYVAIELVAFPDPYNDGGLPVYWGIDIRLSIGVITSAYFMFHLLVGGFVESNSGKYYIEFEEQEDEFTIVEDLFGDNLTNLLTTSKPTRTRTEYTKTQIIKDDAEGNGRNVEDFNKFDERCFFFCWHAEHPDLKDLSIGGLFHMCRLESMTYSIETCKGSVFTIYEILSSHHFGIMGIGNNRQDSIRVLSETFTFILQQAGPPPQPLPAFKTLAREDYNLNELITKVKSIHKTLEKISKSGKKNYLVELL